MPHPTPPHTPPPPLAPRPPPPPPPRTHACTHHPTPHTQLPARLPSTAHITDHPALRMRTPLAPPPGLLLQACGSCRRSTPPPLGTPPPGLKTCVRGAGSAPARACMCLACACVAPAAWALACACVGGSDTSPGQTRFPGQPLPPVNPSPRSTTTTGQGVCDRHGRSPHPPRLDQQHRRGVEPVSLQSIN